MEKTQSATPLSTVLIEPNGVGGTNIWLRKNIVEREVQNDDDGTQVAWEADEIFGTVEGNVSKHEVELRFDELWRRFEDDGKPISDVISDVRNELAVHEDAIVELDMLVNASPTTMEDLVEAVMELAELIGGAE